MFDQVRSARFATLRATGVASAALLAGLAGGTASAQEATETSAEQRGDEIIVTAQRRAESIQDVPIAITAVGEQTLEDSNVQSVEDYFALTPNVNFQNDGSRDRRDLSIRGISNQLNPYSPVRQATYAFYIDEFNVVTGTSNPQVVDLERIEILRGPQGTYFGRNSVGGAINIITKKPVSEFEGEIEAAYSSFDTKRIQGVINVPIIPDVLAVRASGQYEKSDGYIKNINALGGGNHSEYKSGRIQVRLTPNDQFTWDATYAFSDEMAGMRVGVPTGFITATWRSVYYGNRQGNVTDPDGVGFYPQNRRFVNFNRPQDVGTDYHYFSTRAVYEWDDISLTGVIGHIKSNVFNFGDVDGGSPDFYYEDLYLTRKSSSSELRLQSTGNSALQWSIGAMAGRDTGVIDQSTYHGRQSPQRLPEGFEVTGGDSNSESTYWAVFGQATWNITDMWSVVAGGRYSYEKVENRGITRSNQIVTGINDRESSFKDFSPRVTVSFKPNSDVLAYVTASRGFKSGGTQTSNNPNLANEYEPETLWNYEGGLKVDLFDRRLRLDATVFYMDWKNVQQLIRFQFLDAGNNIRAVSGIENASAASSKGFELSADASLTEEFRLSGQVGFTKAKYDRYVGALVDGLVIDASGRPLVNSPRWTLGAQAHYEAPVNDEYDGFFRLEWNFRDEVLSSQLALRYNVYPFISPSYHNFNFRFGVESERIRVTAYVENLFDANYYANAYEKAFYSGVQVDPSVRTFGVSARYKF